MSLKKEASEHSMKRAVQADGAAPYLDKFGRIGDEALDGTSQCTSEERVERLLLPLL